MKKKICRFFYEGGMISQLKLIVLVTSFLPVLVFAQQHTLFSEKAVTVEDYTTKEIRTFLPFTKGEIKIKTSGIYKAVFDKICSIIVSWKFIVPLRGIQVFCYGHENQLEIYFSPYMFEDGLKFPSEGYSKLEISINDPRTIVGSDIVPNIYCCPQKTSDFYGYPVYNIGKNSEVTVVSRKNIPFFIAVTQEEYLKTLIAKVNKETLPIPNKQDYQKTLQEMENNYQKLRKVSIEAAEGIKQAINEFKEEINRNEEYSKSYIDPISILKNRLLSMSEEEKRENAYYGGDDISGLISYGQREYGDLLVKINPALISENLKSGIHLLTIGWEVKKVTVSRNLQLYDEGKLGFQLTDYLMSKLYEDQNIWNRIFSICNKN